MDATPAYKIILRDQHLDQLQPAQFPDDYVMGYWSTLEAAIAEALAFRARHPEIAVTDVYDLDQDEPLWSNLP